MNGDRSAAAPATLTVKENVGFGDVGVGPQTAEATRTPEVTEGRRLSRLELHAGRITVVVHE